MRKKIALFSVALLASAAVLTACGSSEDTQQGSSPTSMTENVTVSTISVASEVSQPEAFPAVETTNQTKKQGKVTLEYPKLTGLSDSSATDRANQLLLKDAEAFAKANLVDQNGNDLGGKGTMEHMVIQHQGTVSVVCTGTVTLDQKKQLMVYTTNLDLHTGKRISTGVREHADLIAQSIVDGKTVVLESDSSKKKEIKSYVQDLGVKKLTALLQSCDFTDTDQNPSSYSYYMDAETDDIGIYLPVSKDLGDYAILLVEKDSLV